MLTSLMLTLLLLQSIAIEAQLPPMQKEPTSIVLRQYTEDSCPADHKFTNEISNTAGCNPITNANITSVEVVPKPDMPSTCVLTLFDDRSCLSTSNAEIGPITPGSDPSACIGPIRNSNGDVFRAKAAMLQC